MPLKLHIGAEDQAEPYGDKDASEVLDILEEKYDLCSTFLGMHAQEIADIAAEGMTQMLEARLRGDRGPKVGAMYDAGTKIKNMFVRDIETKRFDGLLEGVPTQASLEGKVLYGRTVVKRGRASKKKQPGRPSFVYSMTMLRSLRAFFTDNEGQWAPRKPPGK
jgi:hypothetical protein